MYTILDPLTAAFLLVNVYILQSCNLYIVNLIIIRSPEYKGSVSWEISTVAWRNWRPFPECNSTASKSSVSQETSTVMCGVI